MEKKSLFTIAPGAPFLKTFAMALLEGRVVEGYSKSLGPLEIADATIYVPTRRAARALAYELGRALGRPAMLLPRILPLGALEETETSLLFDANGLEIAEEPAGAPDLPEAVGEIARRMQLAELILTWARALRHAIVSVDANGNREVDQTESFLVATTAADAWYLSGELASLIDELIIEDVAWERLDPLVLPEFDPYWRITLDFLTIAIQQWPKILEQRGLVDKARRQVALIEAQSRNLCDGAAMGPVIAIGSTGSNRATADLLAAIARAPRGAVVLPGLDQHMDERAWAMIVGGAPHDVDSSFTHPQASLRRLLSSLQVQRDEVVSLGEVMPCLMVRENFVSQALLPAEATDAWNAYRARVDATELDVALQGVSLIEAADEREEALALAIAMREVLETLGETAALVTPDRELAARVRAELLRWGVEADDSAGEPLSASPIGTLARLVIACAASGLAAVDVAALLAHPLARLGLAPGEVARLAPLLELGLLRSPCAARGLGGDPSVLIAAAREAAKDIYAHPAKQRIAESDWVSLEDLLARLGEHFAPLLNLRGEQHLSRWLKAHRTTLAAITGDDGVNGEDSEALEDLFDELAGSAPASMSFDVDSYAHFFAAVAREIILRGPKRAHPRLKIFGLLEARLVDVDVILLGGLDETVWPPQARTDAFLNRPMRAALGLTPPERKLGQTAHDFVQAMGKRKVILSHARKRAGSPVVASRFLQRMAALGDAAWKACRQRGEFYLHLARAIDRPVSSAPPSERPLPKPPVALRPTRLSVTQIETLRRDPYALYAEKILGLRELDPLGGAIGVGELGSAIHHALERFVAEHPLGPLPPDAREKLRALLRDGLAAHLQDESFAALQWPRLEKTIDFYLGFEARRREKISALKTEISGRLEIPLADGSVFALTARADRIELNRDGSVTLVDYKTGTPPGTKEILVGFAPQLTLEAAMVLRGGFDLGKIIHSVEGLYLKLGGANGGEERPVEFKANGTFMQVAEGHYNSLVGLLDQFRDPATAYPPRPFPKFAKRYNAYDHLARVKEWSLGGETEGGGD